MSGYQAFLEQVDVFVRTGKVSQQTARVLNEINMTMLATVPPIETEAERLMHLAYEMADRGELTDEDVYNIFGILGAEETEMPLDFDSAA